jgi:cobalt/nickel transport system permease protein
MTTSPELVSSEYKDRPSPRRRAKPSFIEKTIAGIAGNIERAVFTEEHARRDALLQRRDPRAKLLAFLVLILAVSLALSPISIVVVYACVLAAAAASRLPLDFYVKRVWLGIPLFAGIVIIPSIFLTPGHPLLRLPLGFASLVATREGLAGAAQFVLRVGASVSLAVLLVLTTKWSDLLKALRILKVPAVFVLILSMTYRYTFLFLHTVTSMFLARKSRSVGVSTGAEQRRWIVASMGTLVSKSFRMSNEVYQAMLSRGFHGEMVAYDNYRMKLADWLLLGASATLAVVVTVVDRGLLR